MTQGQFLGAEAPIHKYMNKLLLVTVEEGDQMDPFSIATILRCREGATSFPGLLHFTLDTYVILLSVKQGGVKYHFKSLWYDATWDWTQVSRTIGKHSTHYANESAVNNKTYLFAEIIYNFDPPCICGVKVKEIGVCVCVWKR